MEQSNSPKVYVLMSIVLCQRLIFIIGCVGVFFEATRMRVFLADVVDWINFSDQQMKNFVHFVVIIHVVAGIFFVKR